MSNEQWEAACLPLLIVYAPALRREEFGNREERLKNLAEPEEGKGFSFLNFIIPVAFCKELYDFARFLVEKYADAHADRSGAERIAAFESEDEMIDYINDVGRQVYAD